MGLVATVRIHCVSQYQTSAGGSISSQHHLCYWPRWNHWCIQAYDRFTSCLAQALKWQAADLLSEAVDFLVSQKLMVGDMATDFSLVKWFKGRQSATGSVTILRHDGCMAGESSRGHFAGFWGEAPSAWATWAGGPPTCCQLWVAHLGVLRKELRFRLMADGQAMAIYIYLVYLVYLYLLCIIMLNYFGYFPWELERWRCHEFAINEAMSSHVDAGCCFDTFRVAMWMGISA